LKLAKTKQMRACLDETMKLKDEFEVAQTRIALQNELSMNKKFVNNHSARPKKAIPLNFEREL